jgi:hypothetical protein
MKWQEIKNVSDLIHVLRSKLPDEDKLTLWEYVAQNWSRFIGDLDSLMSIYLALPEEFKISFWEYVAQNWPPLITNTLEKFDYVGRILEATLHLNPPEKAKKSLEEHIMTLGWSYFIKNASDITALLISKLSEETKKSLEEYLTRNWSCFIKSVYDITELLESKLSEEIKKSLEEYLTRNWSCFIKSTYEITTILRSNLSEETKKSLEEHIAKNWSCLIKSTHEITMILRSNLSEETKKSLEEYITGNQSYFIKSTYEITNLLELNLSEETKKSLEEYITRNWSCFIKDASDITKLLESNLSEETKKSLKEYTTTIDLSCLIKDAHHTTELLKLNLSEKTKKSLEKYITRNWSYLIKDVGDITALLELELSEQTKKSLKEYITTIDWSCLIKSFYDIIRILESNLPEETKKRLEKYIAQDWSSFSLAELEIIELLRSKLSEEAKISLWGYIPEEIGAKILDSFLHSNYDDEAPLAQALIQSNFNRIQLSLRKLETQYLLKHSPQKMQTLFFAAACHPDRKVFLLLLNQPYCRPLSLKSGKTILYTIQNSSLDPIEIAARQNLLSDKINSIQRIQPRQLKLVSLDHVYFRIKEAFPETLPDISTASLEERMPNDAGLERELCTRFLQLYDWLYAQLSKKEHQDGLAKFLQNPAIKTSIIFPNIVERFESCCAVLHRRLSTVGISELEGILDIFIPQLGVCPAGTNAALDGLQNALNQNPFVTTLVYGSILASWKYFASFMHSGMEAHFPEELLLHLGVADKLLPQADAYDPSISQAVVTDMTNRTYYMILQGLFDLLNQVENFLTELNQRPINAFKDCETIQLWCDILRDYFDHPPLNVYRNNLSESFGITDLIAWFANIKPKAQVAEYAALQEKIADDRHTVTIQGGVERLRAELHEAINAAKLINIPETAKLEATIWEYLTSSTPEIFDGFISDLLTNTNAAPYIMLTLERRLEQDQSALSHINPTALFHVAPGSNTNLWRTLMCDSAAFTKLWGIQEINLSGAADVYTQGQIQPFVNWAGHLEPKTVALELDLILSKPGGVLYCLYELSRDHGRMALAKAVAKFCNLYGSNGGILRYNTFYEIIQAMIDKNYEAVLARSFIMDRLPQMLEDKNYGAFWGALPYVEKFIILEGRATNVLTISIKDLLKKYPDLLASLTNKEHLECLIYLFERNKKPDSDFIDYLQKLGFTSEELTTIMLVIKHQYKLLQPSYSMPSAVPFFKPSDVVAPETMGIAAAADTEQAAAAPREEGFYPPPPHAPGFTGPG